MHNPAVTDIEKNIRALTTAIQLIQPQSAATIAPAGAKQSRSLALNKAYNHIAILLTQASQEYNSTGRQVVVLSSSSDLSGLIVNTFQEIEELDDLPSLKNLAITRYTKPSHGPSDGVLLKVEDIMPSGKTLKNLADPCKTYPSLSETFQRLTAFQAPYGSGSSGRTC
jgi:hypothetical protein